MENVYLVQLAKRMYDVGEIVGLTQEGVRTEIGIDIVEGVQRSLFGEPLTESEAYRLFNAALVRIEMVEDCFKFGSRLLTFRDLSHEQCVRFLGDAACLPDKDVIAIAKATLGPRFEEGSDEAMGETDRVMLAMAIKRAIAEKKTKLLSIFEIPHLAEEALDFRILKTRREKDGMLG